jgi:hypothetical protein
MVNGKPAPYAEQLLSPGSPACQICREPVPIRWLRQVLRLIQLKVVWLAPRRPTWLELERAGRSLSRRETEVTIRRFNRKSSSCYVAGWEHIQGNKRSSVKTHRYLSTVGFSVRNASAFDFFRRGLKLDLGRLPPFQRARQISARDGSGLTRRARRARYAPSPSPDAPPGEPAGAIPSGSTRRLSRRLGQNAVRRPPSARPGGIAAVGPLLPSYGPTRFVSVDHRACARDG